jgi:hypothetical protein
MNFLNVLRNGKHRAAPDHDDDGENPSADTRELPVDRYRRLDERKAIAELPQLTQVELATIESFERSHRARPAVLGKLRYLQQVEPLPGYDGLGVAGIGDALSHADLATVKAVREYERKLQNRAPVLTEVAHALHRCIHSRPSVGAEAPLDPPDHRPVIGNGPPAS